MSEKYKDLPQRIQNIEAMDSYRKKVKVLFEDFKEQNNDPFFECFSNEDKNKQIKALWGDITNSLSQNIGTMDKLKQIFIEATEKDLKPPAATGLRFNT